MVGGGRAYERCQPVLLRLVTLAATPRGTRPLAPLPRPAQGHPRYLTPVGTGRAATVTNRDCSAGIVEPQTTRKLLIPCAYILA
jgi:hypothetical protein